MELGQAWRKLDEQPGGIDCVDMLVCPSCLGYLFRLQGSRAQAALPWLILTGLIQGHAAWLHQVSCMGTFSTVASLERCHWANV